MNTGNSQQFMPAYRSREVTQLFRWIKDGESASVIGVSNIGKSNLFQYLLDPAAQAHYLSSNDHKYIFLRVNFHNLPDFQCRSVYSLILEQIEAQDPATLPEGVVETIGKYHDAMLNSSQDELKIQRFFKLALRMVMQDPNHLLVLLFDQFDLLYQKAGEQLFNNLRGLRDTYKYRISYLVFTRDPLSDLPVDIDLQETETDETIDDDDPDVILFADRGARAREEFYELLQPNQLFLKPFDLKDTEQTIHSLATRKRLPLEKTWIEPLYRLTGGHAGLLRMCYSFVASTWAQNAVDEDVSLILQNDAIRQECQRIWGSLSDIEQIELAARVKAHPTREIDESAVLNLKQKGILTEGGEIFSTLFAQFITGKKTRLDRLVYLDIRKRIVYYLGQPSKPLTKTEYLMFKKLYDRQNSIVTQDELISAVWPKGTFDEKSSSQAVTTNIYRIRQKLGISEKGKDKLIETKHGQGYIINTEPGEKNKTG